MELLKKIVQGCRQNYEKVVLTVALVGLGLAVWFLYEAGLAEEQKIAEYFKGVEKRPVKRVPSVNIATNRAALAVASNPPSLNLAGGHYLFNPVMWQRKSDGSLLKIDSANVIGPSKLLATKIRPLNLSVALDRVAISGEPPNVTVTGYHMVSTNEAALPPHPRRQPQFANVNLTNRNAVFILREVKGPPEAPDELLVELKDGERVKVLPGQPFIRTVAYQADLIYPITGKAYSNLRQGTNVVVAGDPYKISDITQDMVEVSDESNLKTYKVKLAPPQ